MIINEEEGWSKKTSLYKGKFPRDQLKRWEKDWYVQGAARKFNI